MSSGDVERLRKVNLENGLLAKANAGGCGRMGRGRMGRGADGAAWAAKKKPK